VSRLTPPVEPLFAHAARLWLRVWGATQGVALVAALVVVLDRAGGPRAFLAAPAAGRALLVLAALIVYHAAGLLAYDRILRRRWAVVLFVPLGWALVLLAPGAIGPAFALLVVGAVIQGFIFLPFSWAVATLALAVVAPLVTIAAHARARPTSVVLTQVVGLLSTAIMIGTVMLYIHRANRDAAIRTRLLAQLDAAQRDLAERAREAGAQEERQRLARDIHDTLAQGFTSVIKHLEAVELSFAGAEGPNDVMRGALPHLAHAQAVSRESLAEIRRLVWALRPAPLAEAPLAAAIARIVARWGEANGVAATCALDPLPPLRPEADVVFLRATQESLSNVARHAAASRVAVTMHCVDGLALLTVEDDGRGFAESEEGAGVGLAGMRERVRRFGGHVLIESAPGAGTSLTVAMPLTEIAVPTAALDRA
jgi:signal transduction histidine kinase